MTAALKATPAAGDTRQRLIDIAAALFIRHSFAGTSLQMIADEFGITKAAVYHHFHTREDLLTAVVQPLVGELQTIVETAEAQRSAHARAEHMLTGYAELVVRNQGLMSILAGDPGVIDMLRSGGMGRLIERQIKLLADLNPGSDGMVKAAMVLAGIAGAAGPRLINLDDDTLRRHLVDAGRRTLGLRTPRAPLAKNAAPADETSRTG